jgi:hypothetical protein
MKIEDIIKSKMAAISDDRMVLAFTMDAIITGFAAKVLVVDKDAKVSECALGSAVALARELGASLEDIHAFVVAANEMWEQCQIVNNKPDLKVVT